MDIAPEFQVVNVIRQFDGAPLSDLLHIEVNEYNMRTFEFDFPVASIHDRNVLQLLAQNGVVIHPNFLESIVDILFKEYNAC
ncbi:MAG: hypothetical protein K2N74_04560, partial [Clostridiales bacterium]|nr:hypothetical protein [Clostridiales bacterium]